MPLRRLPLALHTNVAELIEQLRFARVRSFGRGASFLKRERRGRAYWYVRSPMFNYQRQERYLGAETPELLAAISEEQQYDPVEEDRAAVVRGLVTAGLPRPDVRTGRVLATLADAGVFRLRGVVVGTVAFQSYGPLLGVHLPNAAVRTGDLDIAQDYGISVALDDALDEPLLTVLRRAYPDFQASNDPFDPTQASKFTLPDGFSVDVLTTSRGSGNERKSRLPAMQADATPLRHLDFLLRDAVEAVVLWADGVLVNVPAPARYAVHKLIVSRRRGVANPKSRKDLDQATTLIDVLSSDDPFALRAAYAEARGWGAVWRALLDEAVQLIPEGARASLG